MVGYPRTVRQAAAEYIARHLADANILVATDPTGYRLAIALARQAGPSAIVSVYRLLKPLVEASAGYGQRAPSGWSKLVVAEAQRRAAVRTMARGGA